MTAAPIVVTGAAGFVGSSLVDRLLADGRDVIGIDSFEPFYPRAAKERNIRQAVRSARYRLYETDIRDAESIRRIIGDARPAVVVDFSARAGVRDSLRDPQLYIDINVRGLQNLLSAAASVGATYVFASSSSIYGSAASLPFDEDDIPCRPESPYAATKIAGEALVMSHHAVSGLPVRIARLFTVYGPRQRPDLAVHKFAARILDGESIPLFAEGRATRDYTYVDDIVDGFARLIEYSGPFIVVNLASHRPYTNLELVRALERSIGKTAAIELLPPQPGDVPATFGKIDRAKAALGWQPRVDFEQGLAHFRSWFVEERRASARKRSS